MSAPAEQLELTGEMVGGYRLGRKLGAGAAGSVYATKGGAGEALAIKILHFDPSDEVTSSRFRRESELSSRVRHPNAVPTLDSGFDKGQGLKYIVMPLLEGRDVESLADEHAPLEPQVACRIVLQAARGLAAAHRLGIVHRDVKPSNLFLESDSEGNVTVRVCDFGIAKRVLGGQHTQLTASGALLGTPLYMSPEQLKSAAKVDERTDVWALGVTLYELLSAGHPLGTPQSLAELMLAMAGGELQHLQDIAPWIDVELTLTVHTALQADLARRWHSMEELIEALEPHCGGGTELHTSMFERASPTTVSALGQRADLTLAGSGKQRISELDPFVGRTLGERYAIQRLIGRGGMGAVYEATDTDGTKVAAKVIEANAKDDRPLIRRFVREARAASAINSPYVVRTVEAGEDAELGIPFLIMELLQGRDLSELLEQLGPLQPAAAVRLFIQAAKGLQTAHDLGIVHRDIKPANLFLHQSGDRVVIKVCDFGVAKALGTDSPVDQTSQELTRTGGMIGSPIYMSPEQAKSAKHVDQRSDIWSLSVAMWETLTGHRLWEGDLSLGEVVLAICTEQPRLLSDVAPWVPPELSAVVHRGLQKDPNERWTTMNELVGALEPFAEQTDVAVSELNGVDPALRQSATQAQAAQNRRLVESAETVASSPTSAALAQSGAAVVQTAAEGVTTAAADAPVAGSKRVATIAVALVAALGAGGAAAVFWPGDDPAPASTTTTAADAPPADPPAPSAELRVEPDDVTVSIDGKQVDVIDGGVSISAEPGTRLDVVLQKGDQKQTERVIVLADGRTEPEVLKLEELEEETLDAGSEPAAAGKPAAPSPRPTPQPRPRTAPQPKPTPAAKPTPTPAPAPKPAPAPAPAPKPAGVKPKLDWQ